MTEAEESISNARLFLPAFFASVSDSGRLLTKVYEVYCIIKNFVFQMANDTGKNSQWRWSVTDEGVWGLACYGQWHMCSVNDESDQSMTDVFEV